MDRASALTALNGKILAAYSARTVSALRAALPLRLALPHLEPVLALNVDKEIRKDALVIRRAGAMLAAGTVPGRDDAQQLFVDTQAIDGAFVQRVDAFPVRVVIRYEEIEPLRMRRIQRLLEAAYRILAAWHDQRRLRTALTTLYTESDFERMMFENLDLYARETRALSRSVRLPALLTPLRERMARHLLEVMSATGARLARELTRSAYRRRMQPAGNAPPSRGIPGHAS